VTGWIKEEGEKGERVRSKRVSFMLTADSGRWIDGLTDRLPDAGG
jgi:hypothetical protein